MPTPPSVSPASAEPPASVVRRLRDAGCVFAEEEAQLLVAAAETPEGLAEMVERRVDGQPLEHVVGWAEFCGLRIAVDHWVFVPRRRTEFLVHEAAAAANLVAAARTAGGSPVVVVDLCCGSGAVGVAVTAAVKGAELYAVDVEPAAVRCARRNVEPAGGSVYEGDLFEPLPSSLGGQIDVLLANVPYVPTEAIGLMPPEARLHEPRVALDGGADGLDVLRRVAAAAPRWLAPGGQVFVETSQAQAPVAVDVFEQRGLLARVASSDDLGSTVVVGSQPTDAA